MNKLKRDDIIILKDCNCLFNPEDEQDIIYSVCDEDKYIDLGDSLLWINIYDDPEYFWYE